jgi:hypothetical protein
LWPTWLGKSDTNWAEFVINVLRKKRAHVQRLRVKMKTGIRKCFIAFRAFARVV